MDRKWWEIPGVIFLMLVLALISTYPLIFYFDTGIPYAPFGGPKVWNRSGDQIQLMYWFWLVKENFLGAVPFDTNPFEFNMPTPHESSGLNTIPLAFLYMLFSPLGDITAYNCTIISSYILTGTFMYLLVRLYTGSRVGALLGAIIFTIAPSRVNGFAAGHGYGFLYFCYPFILYFLEKGIRSKKIRYGFLSGLGLIGLAMLEPHLIYYICVFLGIYIPVRVLVLLPVHQDAFLAEHEECRGIYCWSVPRSLFFLWGAGAAVTFYAQVLFANRDNDPFITQFFWWIFVIYPFIPVLTSFCFASLYQRLSPLGFRQSLAVEAGSLLPLYFFIPLSLLPFINKPADTTILVISAIVLITFAKLVLLRKHLFMMVRVLLKGLKIFNRHIWPIIPVIVSMGWVVAWIVFSKVDKVATTIARGGRRLDDVGFFSSRLSDLFLPTSNVYIGIVPAVLTGGFFLVLFLRVFTNKKNDQFSNEAEFIALFYIVMAFCCFILAMGLALGKSSLYILFYHYFPFFNYPRVSDRIIIMVLFSLAIVTGFVVQFIQQRCRNRVSLGTVTVLMLMALGFQLKDYNVFKPMGINILDRGQDIYTHVRENIGDGLLLEIPLWPGESHQSSLYQHYIMLDRVPRVNGSSPMVLTDYIQSVFKPLASINQGRLDREQFELLHKMGVKFITVHDNRDVFLEKVSPFVPLTTVRRLKNSPYLEFVAVHNMMYFKTWKGKNDKLYLFKVKDKEAVSDEAEQAWYDMPYFYGVNSRLRKQTGVITKDKMIDRMVFEATEVDSRPGFLIYGPYDYYSPGDYRVFFTIYTSSSGDDDAVARIEVSRVTDNHEVEVITQAEIKGDKGKSTYKKKHLGFSIKEETELEFRVFYYGKGEVRVEKVAVYKAGKNKQLNFMEAEKMVGDTGQLVFKEDASGGKVISAIARPGKTEKKDLVYGPNRTYPKGKYTARYYLRTQRTSGDCTDIGGVALLSVTDEMNVTTYSQREVSACELNDSTFTGIDVDFSLNRDLELSFRARSTGKANLQLDKIEIQQR